MGCTYLMQIIGMKKERVGLWDARYALDEVSAEEFLLLRVLEEDHVRHRVKGFEFFGVGVVWARSGVARDLLWDLSSI